MEAHRDAPTTQRSGEIQMKTQTALNTVLIASLAAAVPHLAHAQAAGASAVLRDAGGRTIGTALLTEAGTAVRISLQARGLPPGPHGIHIHAVGQCEPPMFASAGAHFNPDGRQHGLNNPQGAHAGDLPALVAAANGTASYAATNAMVRLSAGPNSLFDEDGSAIVIHANDDDQVTDPTGNSGDRVACGVIVRGAAALPSTGAGGPAVGVAGVVGLCVAAVGAALGALRLRRAKR